MQIMKKVYFVYQKDICLCQTCPLVGMCTFASKLHSDSVYASLDDKQAKQKQLCAGVPGGQLDMHEATTMDAGRSADESIMSVYISIRRLHAMHSHPCGSVRSGRLKFDFDYWRRC